MVPCPNNTWYWHSGVATVLLLACTSHGGGARHLLFRIKVGSRINGNHNATCLVNVNYRAEQPQLCGILALAWAKSPMVIPWLSTAWCVTPVESEKTLLSASLSKNNAHPGSSTAKKSRIVLRAVLITRFPTWKAWELKNPALNMDPSIPSSSILSTELPSAAEATAIWYPLS